MNGKQHKFPWLNLAFHASALTCHFARPNMPDGRRFIFLARATSLEEFVNDWRFAQKNPSEELAILHHFSFKKLQSGSEVIFLITVKEFVTPPQGQFAKFFAQADKEVNQRTAPIIPTGWGASLLDALSDCTRMIRDFPYEGEETIASRGSTGG